MTRIISVIVPCRNEQRHIGAFCASVLKQQLPEDWQMELLIADGISSDGTRELLIRLASADPRIVWLDNPGRIVSTGLNRALARSSGEVIVRMDVHTEYAPDYIAQCLAALQETGADNVGGPWHAVPDEGAGPMQVAVAAAFQSRWVAGGAASRSLDHSGWVDTVYLGCWPRASFEKFGPFDEHLVRNQDDEHNLRIAKGGGKVWQSAAIRSVYRPRARLGQVARQYLQYGYWKPFVMKKHGQAASARQAVPGAFVLMLALAAVLALLGVTAWPLLMLVLAYGAAVLAMTLLVGREAEGRPGFNGRAMLRVPLAIATYHLSYGVGSLVGAWDAFVRRQSRPGFGVLTR
jgi:glycosyltransferase involved in cell wall biosynthesis